MDAKEQMVEKSSNSSSNDRRIQDEAGRIKDTSLVVEMVMVNPASLSMTHADIEDIKASESTEASHSFAKVDTDGNFSSTRVFPDVPFDSKSSKEIDSKEMDQSIFSDDESNTRDVPDVLLDSESSKESQIKKVWPTEDNIEKDYYPTHGNGYQHYENRFQGCFGKGIQEE